MAADPVEKQVADLLGRHFSQWVFAGVPKVQSYPSGVQLALNLSGDRSMAPMLMRQLEMVLSCTPYKGIPS